MSSAPMLLSINNVSKRFGGVEALRGVSMDLAAGEVGRRRQLQRPDMHRRGFQQSPAALFGPGRVALPHRLAGKRPPVDRTAIPRACAQGIRRPLVCTHFDCLRVSMARTEWAGVRRAAREALPGWRSPPLPTTEPR